MICAGSTRRRKMRSSIFFCAGESPWVFPEICSTTCDPTVAQGRARAMIATVAYRVRSSFILSPTAVAEITRRPQSTTSQSRSAHTEADAHQAAGRHRVHGGHHRLPSRRSTPSASSPRPSPPQPDALHRGHDPRRDRGSRARPVAARARCSASWPAPSSAGSSPASSPRALRLQKLEREQKELIKKLGARVRQAAEAREAARRGRQGAHQRAAGRLREPEGGVATGAARAGRGHRGQGPVHQGPLRPHRRVLDGARPRGAALERERPGDARVRRLPPRHRQDRRHATRCCSSPARSTTTSGST